jgi:hypothetical protein
LTELPPSLVTPSLVTSSLVPSSPVTSSLVTSDLAMPDFAAPNLATPNLATPGLDNVRKFLSVMATELHETILRLERTTARVTELTALRTARPDRDLVVALQDFDRLQQEFVSFADTFASAAAKSPESWQQSNDDGHPAGDAVAKIPLTDLKARILRQLGAADADFAEVVF